MCTYGTGRNNCPTKGQCPVAGIVPRTHQLAVQHATTRQLWLLIVDVDYCQYHSVDQCATTRLTALLTVHLVQHIIVPMQLSSQLQKSNLRPLLPSGPFPPESRVICPITSQNGLAACNRLNPVRVCGPITPEGYKKPVAKNMILKFIQSLKENYPQHKHEKKHNSAHMP